MEKLSFQWKTCLFWQRSVYFFNTFERGGFAATFSHSLGEEWIQFFDFSLLIQTSNDWEI